MSELVLPRHELILPELHVVRAVVDHALEPLGLRVGRITKKIQDYISQMAGFSDATENKIMDFLYRGIALTPPSPRFLALTTSAVNETNTAGTLTEAAYTGYARLSLADAVFTAAAAGEVHNTATQTFAACTGGTATVIGWAICSAVSGAGDIYHFGTCTSTVISTTQTPATINASALSMSLD